MKYLEKSFSVGNSGKKYRDGWDRIFGSDKDTEEEKIESEETEEEAKD